MIAIIDYGMGNLRSVQKGFERVGFEAIVTDDPSVVRRADAIVLPGVGAFGAAMERLRRSGLAEETIRAIEKGKPYLGICLGLQLLLSESEEGGRFEGMDLIKGRVVRFQTDLKVPHMGWNQVKILKPNPLLKGIPDNSYFYFVHSYYVLPDDKSLVAGTTEYGVEFTSMVWRDNLFAVQFHPEKSQRLGLRILKNFGELAET
ncbi:TPA: imidazole glycerol phosphate synthase subunit HisH [Candidatus Poribacteria bacterium]|nr:imidazole glycerol phosphate synthase subunit HisH [Candidatus Poribacteria bacterium]